MTELSCASTENWWFLLLFEKKKLKYFSMYFTCESHSNIKNFLVTFCFACFSFMAILSDKISLIKWTSHCLFTMLPWRHKVNALWLVHLNTKSLFQWHYIIKSYITYISPNHLRFFCLPQPCLAVYGAAASPASCLRSDASLAVIFLSQLLKGVWLFACLASFINCKCNKQNTFISYYF